MSDSKTRAIAPPGKLNSTPLSGLSLPIDFLTPNNSKTCSTCGAHNLSPVEVITGGFPCQDISLAGRKPTGLRGERSGLFWEVIRILKETQRRWVVLENVVNLLAVNDS